MKKFHFLIKMEKISERISEKIEDDCNIRKTPRLDSLSSCFLQFLGNFGKRYEAGEKIIIAAFKDGIEAGREEERSRRKDGSK